MLVRLAVAGYLRDRGFQVLEAANGAEAVAILSADIAVDVVCSHVQMPGDLNGFALARWVRSNRPSVQTLLTSGHVGEDDPMPLGDGVAISCAAVTRPSRNADDVAATCDSY